jgi:uncharacterized membrane protein YdjX (TVP38/TMEM64 family)
LSAPRRSRTRSRNAVVAGLLLALALAALAAVYAVDIALPGWFGELTPAAFRRLVLSWGEWGVVAAILLMVAHSFIPFPAELVAIANGMTFGPLWGTVITWVGAMLGALLSFALSRRFGRPFAARMMRRYQLEAVDDWLDRYGGEAVFACRFIPVIAFNLINYGAGLSRISYWHFTWATGLGILPLTTLMVVLGAEMEELPLYAWILMAAGAAALWLAASRLLIGRRPPKGAP